jgi:hypothetical protein
MKPYPSYLPRLLATWLLLLCALAGLQAQVYNNEWIDYSQTYYKFKVGKAGVYRIPQSTVAAIGWGSTPVNQFKLWRNGQEVMLYTSVASGALPINGYIEFIGHANDGKPDKPLYRDPTYQHSDKLSLQTDTAAYFLTVINGANKRATTQPNNTATNTLPAELYFMYTQGKYFKTQISKGFAAVIGEYVYSSAYDKGEFLSSTDITPGATFTDAQYNLYPFTSGPNAQLKFGAVGKALNVRSIRYGVNGTQLGDVTCDYFNDALPSANFAASLLSTGNANVEFVNTSSTASDRMTLSYYELTYPRQYNFGGSSFFELELPSKPSGHYLEITNFNTSGVPPVLYDFAYGERYVGDITVPGLVKFSLPGRTGSRKLVLISQTSATINTINPADLQQRNFLNLTDPANQGNYLIISNPLLYNGSNGNNPIIDYQNYRSSLTGGSYAAKVYDADELVDQFAFGISKHPLGTKNFLRYARANFISTPPQFVLLIGHGLNYKDYYENISNPLDNRLNLVPTFGYPASDNMLASADAANPLVLTPIGRISAVSGKEVENYLEKIKEYESVQVNSPNTLAGRAWMKNVMQVTGASDSYLGTVLCNYMDTYKQILEDSLMGARVNTFCKNTVTPVEQISNDRIAQLFEEGLSMVTYFGHSSSTTLEFNIDDPQAYNNQGKYPIFSVNGCNAGNFFVFSPQRFVYNETLSEKFTLAKQRGSIAFVASTHFGIVNYLNVYLNNLSNQIGKESYGQPLGLVLQHSMNELIQTTGAADYFSRLHAEEITLHGDPALKLNAQPRADYVMEESEIRVSPSFISVADGSFSLKVKVHNIGKVVSDSVSVQIKIQRPDNSIETIFNQKIKPIHFVDSVNLQVPIIGIRDKGLNKIIVTLDSADVVTEMSETNNTASKEFYIYEDELRPIYPYNYGVVNKQNIPFYASTANPFIAAKDYVMELDTTELFNSAIKLTKNIRSVGGLVDLGTASGITFQDSLVYYWRTAATPINATTKWSTSSFVYRSRSSSEGFNQSHYYQHLHSDTIDVSLKDNRQWKLGFKLNDLAMNNGVYPASSTSLGNYEDEVNTNTLLGAGCYYDEIIFHVLDPISFKPWVNSSTGVWGGSTLYGSEPTCGSKPNRLYTFTYLLNSVASRNRAMAFLDMLPDSAYVIVKTNANPNVGGNTYASVWKTDAPVPTGNSLYNRLLNQGFIDIDSFNRPRAFIFLYKKNAQTDFPSKSVFSPGVQLVNGVNKDNVISLRLTCPTPDTVGYITSPIVGPAKGWKTLYWRGNSIEQPSNDKVKVSVIGVDNSGVETLLYDLNQSQQDFDLSSISAQQYPYMRLQMEAEDAKTLSPYQLQYWTVDYEGVPEGALAPSIYLSGKDTVDIGEPLSVGIAFKNISNVAFDSLKLRVYVLDRNNVSHPVTVVKQKPLIASDTIQLNLLIDTKDYAGANTLYLEFNPNKDQPEQYSFNNFMFKNFYVRADGKAPLLDVTFDNVHILNKDIVSATPHIQIKLKDESKYLLLTDTTGMVVQVRYPGATGALQTYRFDGDTLRFTAAANGTDNTATIDFFPRFLNQIDAQGDEYELIVKGKDRSNNKAGAAEYRIAFRIISKPMVSNLLNYPNPFTTSTAFVFTLTGSKVPDNMKIQILTVTGKVVREITKQELGPLHIGRNITDYKWDGNDQYGQRLGNGVYLYRFVTTLEGKPLEKFSQDRDKNGQPLANGENTDRFFNNGYGKMYLMR